MKKIYTTSIMLLLLALVLFPTAGCQRAYKEPIVPDDFVVPPQFETDTFRLRMLSVSDAEKDYEALMESAERLRSQNEGRWPREGCWAASIFTPAPNRSMTPW